MIDMDEYVTTEQLEKMKDEMTERENWKEVERIKKMLAMREKTQKREKRRLL